MGEFELLCRGEGARVWSLSPLRSWKSQTMSCGERLGEGNRECRVGGGMLPSPQPSPRNEIMGEFELLCLGEGARVWSLSPLWTSPASTT